MTVDHEAPFDAVVLVSFGGPEGPEDVLPFLRNVTAGRNIPDERLAVVGEHYALFGGVSPINGQNRALVEALRNELDRAGIDLPVYWGNRNWHPLLTDTASAMAQAGHKRALALVTSAFGSYSGCRQYTEDLRRAQDGVDGLQLVKARLYWNHPGFIEAMADRITDALDRLPSDDAPTRLVFTAHSIPTAWIAAAPYVDQLRAAAGHLAELTAPGLAWDLAFQSRSGPPQVPWLEPDIVDHLGDLSGRDVERVVVVPLGFVSDHMEVVYDLDTEAAAAADDLNMTFVRAATAGTHPAFVAMLRDLVVEQIEGAPARSVLGEAWPNPCPQGCCDVR